MAAPVVYHDVAPGANLHGQLFAGKKFWVAQRVFSRSRYLDLIRTNGGKVVLLEKKADYLIADHVRKDCPPGSISYTFIDDSIEKGEIQDPESHRAGPPEGTARAPGSMSRPAKGTRTPYTAEEDMILYKWVYDCINNGGLANGNAIYKQLEEKHPRHTWQSWRDRYVKILQHRPPSAFNIPDNAPPSPPSDAPAEPAPVPAPTSNAKATTTTSGSSSRKAKASKKVTSVEYTVEELTAQGLFEKEDWEMLYAFAADISKWEGEEYRQGWRGWAEGRPQTAGQWRQYFEKVVWPQWREDPEEKHEEIRIRVEKRQEEEDHQQASQADENESLSEQDEPEGEPSTPRSKAPNTKRKRTDPDDNLFESYLNELHKGKSSSAYVLFAREKKWALWNERTELDYAGLHKVLMSRWNALSSEEKAPYLAQEAAEQSRTANKTVTLSSQVFLSSSTVVNETPKYITEAYNKALRQLREGSGTQEPQMNDQDETTHPTKRQKSIKSHPGTAQDPVEVSSTGTDSQELTQDDLPEFRPAERWIDESDESDMGGLEAIAPPPGVAERDAGGPASDSPTPRAPCYKTSFDTQAILSSPSQGATLHALPLPARLTQLAEAEAEDSGDKLVSDASTTESLQEFSQIVNEDFDHRRGITPLPHPHRSSPPQSPASSTASIGSGDPDPPLTPGEVDEYFDEQHAEGFPDEFIASALKHTRWRPELATEVLQAWKEQQPVPNKRGIWSESDDEEVEGGDGAALARLERKHTLDGWGGVTERLNFLAKYRDAKG